MLEVGNMRVVLLKKTVSSELDTYKITIQKPRSVSKSAYTQACYCLMF